MKLAVVSQRVDAHPERRETRDALDVRMVEFMSAANVLSMPVPNALGGRLPAWLARVAPDLVVLSGGNDIGEQPRRDATERALLAYARERLLPLLGLCRGMQMMADFAGMGLRPVAGHVGTRHALSGAIQGEVNSYHAHALRGCPQGYEVLASSADGAIEAIRHRTLPWEGWMWHPERERTFAPEDVERLRALVAAGRAAARRAMNGGFDGIQ